jgi:hypothetical protein
MLSKEQDLLMDSNSLYYLVNIAIIINSNDAQLIIIIVTKCIKQYRIGFYSYPMFKGNFCTST